MEVWHDAAEHRRRIWSFKHTAQTPRERERERLLWIIDIQIHFEEFQNINKHTHHITGVLDTGLLHAVLKVLGFVGEQHVAGAGGGVTRSRVQLVLHVTHCMRTHTHKV